MNTAWKELLNASIIGISEQAILFTYAGPINDMTMPGKIHNRNPNVTHKDHNKPAKKYLLKFLNNILYGTFQAMISWFLQFHMPLKGPDLQN